MALKAICVLCLLTSFLQHKSLAFIEIIAILSWKCSQSINSTRKFRKCTIFYYPTELVFLTFLSP
jgi:hypothetical protein